MNDGRIYIAIAGNIGAGKSTLVDFLCRTYGISPFFEPNDENPYLADFYQDMKAWGFHSQIFFLAHKFRIHQELDRTPGVVVQDRTIYEDAEIFATALQRSGKMSARDWKTYEDLYRAICDSLRPPDLMIYLKCSLKTTKQRIKIRGRAMEQNIPTSYLKLLQELYDEWFARWNSSDVLTLDTDRLDYISDFVDRLDLQARIESHLPRAAIEAARLSASRLARSADGPTTASSAPSSAPSSTSEPPDAAPGSTPPGDPSIDPPGDSRAAAPAVHPAGLTAV